MKSNPTDEIQTGQSIHNHLKEVAQFTASFATAMLSAGATTSRIERCVGRIAKGYGVDSVLSILPTRVLITVWDKEHEHNYSFVGETHSDGINLNTSTLLSNLSHLIEYNLPLDIANEKLNQALSRPRINPWIVIGLTSLANLSFCQLFGGDLVAMGIVFVATAVGFIYKNRFMGWKWDGKLVVLLSSLISALIGTSGFIFGISNTPEIALGTSVLWLVPGIRFINAVSDMLRGHYMVAQSRMAESVIVTICLSIGLCLALLISNIKWI